MTPSVAIIILIGFAAIGAIRSVPQKGITQIDIIRRTYLQVEAQLWNYIEANESPTVRLSEIFAQHRNFTDAYLPDAQLTNGDSNEFIVLNGLYEWKVIENDLRAMNNLFSVYRMTLDQYRNALGEFNEPALTDLVKTVLQDDSGPFKVRSTLDQIENVMVRQNLYYKAMLVGVVAVALDCGTFMRSVELVTSDKKLIRIFCVLIIRCRRPRTRCAPHGSRPSRCCTSCTPPYR